MTLFDNSDDDWKEIALPLTSEYDQSRGNPENSRYEEVQRREIQFPKQRYSRKARHRFSRSINLVSGYSGNKLKKTKKFGEEASPLVQDSSATQDFFSSNKLYVDVPDRHSIFSLVQTQDPISTVTKKNTRSVGRANQGNENNNYSDSQSNSIFSHGFCCCQCVRTQEVGIIERFGRFQEIIYQPGCYCLPWPFIDIPGRLSLRVQQLDITCETKTKDNVFVHISVAIHYHVIAEKTYDAYYRLTDPRTQIESYVFDVIRSTVPRMELDELFISKAKIAIEVRKSLYFSMKEFGYSILDTLVVDISPDAKTKASMNAINASKRLKEALMYTAESEKIKRIKEAEAQCESMYLSGVGISRQRKALSEGLRTSVDTLMTASEDIEASNVMSILLLSQYFDMMSSVGSSSLVCSYNPSQVADIKMYRL